MRPVARIALFAIACVAAAVDLRAQNPNQVYFEFQVTKPVRQAPGSRAPRYPVELKASGVQGEVLAQFIVDTLGMPDMDSFKVLRSHHGRFTDAVREALPDMRFTPAEMNGRKVRQLVQQPFVFAIAGREGERPVTSPNTRSMSALDLPPLANLPRTPAPPLGKVEGWMITQSITVDSGNGSAPVALTSRMHGSAGRLRVEITSGLRDALGGMVTLVDSTANRRSQVMPSRKMVMVSSLADQGRVMVRTEPYLASRTITDLGEGERIAGLPTRHYRVEGMSGTRVTLGDRTCVIERPTHAEMWTTPDATAAAMLRNLRGIGSLLQNMVQIGQGAGGAQGRMPPGTPLKSISRLNLTGSTGVSRAVTITTEITAFSSGPIDAALFAAPEGYQVLDASATGTAARVDSLFRRSMERSFTRMTDSTATAPGEKRSCTTTSKP